MIGTLLPRLDVVSQYSQNSNHLGMPVSFERPYISTFRISLSPLPQKRTNKMSTLSRTLRNLRRIGLREAAHQMQYIGDTKAGTLIGTDRYGNKYFENQTEELPLRTRWVDYKNKEYDSSQIEPGWHAWMSYLVDKPPTEDKIMQLGIREWETKEHRPNVTLGRAAYRPYST